MGKLSFQISPRMTIIENYQQKINHFFSFVPISIKIEDYSLGSIYYWLVNALFHSPLATSWRVVQPNPLMPCPHKYYFISPNSLEISGNILHIFLFKHVWPVTSHIISQDIRESSATESSEIEAELHPAKKF